MEEEEITPAKEPTTRNAHILTAEQKKLLDETTQKFKFPTATKIGRTHLTEHVIDTADAKPIKQKQYVFGYHLQKPKNRREKSD